MIHCLQFVYRGKYHIQRRSSESGLMFSSHEILILWCKNRIPYFFKFSVELILELVDLFGFTMKSWLVDLLLKTTVFSNLIMCEVRSYEQHISNLELACYIFFLNLWSVVKQIPWCSLVSFTSATEFQSAWKGSSEFLNSSYRNNH